MPGRVRPSSAPPDKRLWIKSKLSLSGDQNLDSQKLVGNFTYRSPRYDVFMQVFEMKPYNLQFLQAFKTTEKPERADFAMSDHILDNLKMLALV